MKKIRMFCLLTLICITASAQVKPTISWVNFMSDDPAIASISSGIDGLSKVYTAGRISLTTKDIRVQCTDSAGTVLWTYTYDYGGYDCPARIRVDATGNCYVAGHSFDGSTNSYDYVILKLSASGSLVWACRFDGSTQDDYATDVVVDATGDVYATGRSMNTSGDYDAITLKINGSTGTLNWNVAMNPANLDDYGVCLTLANNQADLIVGGDCDFGSGSDIYIYQLNATTGAIGWVQQINGTNNAADHINSIILAGSNIVFAGLLDNSGTGQDYTVTKLDAISGVPVFQNSYDFSSVDRATSIVRDSTGNIAVTGVVLKSGLYEYHTQLYDSTGTLLWTQKKETGCASLNADPVVVCDTIAHHFYVSGEYENASRDVMVYQITPGGNLAWMKTYDAPSGSTDVATSLVVNGLGVIFLSANTTNSSAKFDLTTMRITQTPVYYPIDFNNANEPPAPNWLYYRNTGEILYDNGTQASEVGFYTKNTAPQLFIRKNSVSFLTRWEDQAAIDSVERIDMDFANASNFSETFWFETQNLGYLNYFKPNCGGASGITDVKGSRRLMVPEIYKGVDLHYYSNKDGLKLYFVIKPSYSPNPITLHFDGNISTSLNGSNELSVLSSLSQIKFKAPKVYNVSASISGTVVTFTTTSVTGALANISSDDYNFNVGTYNPMWPLVICLEQKELEGVHAETECDWSTFWGGTGIDEAYNVTTDASGNSFFIGQTDSPNFPSLTGGYLTTTTGKDAFLVKVNANGAGVWGTFYGGNATVLGDNSKPFGVGLNSSGQIYICGSTDSFSLPVVPTSTYSNQGGSDAFIAKFNGTGNSLLFARYIGSAGNDAALELTLDGSNNVYLGGHAGGTTGFPLTNPGGGAYFQNSSADNSDAFIAKFNSSDVLTWCTLFGGNNTKGDKEEIQSVKVFPNGNLIASGVTNAAIKASSNILNPPCGVPLSPSDFPDCTPTGAYTQNYSSLFTNFLDNMIIEFDPSGALVWSTYYGGDAREYTGKIALIPGSSTDFYLYGNTFTENGPLSLGIPGTYVQNYNSSGAIPRGFVARFHLRDNSWSWHSLIGEGDASYVNGGVCDNSGNLYLCGQANPDGYTAGATCTTVALADIFTDFPKCFPSGVFNQPSYGGGQFGDAFLMAFRSNPAFGNPDYMGPFQMHWSTFYGAANTDIGMALGYDSFTNKLVFTGYTQSGASGFPLRDPAIGNYQQNTNAGSAASPANPSTNKDCFFAKFCLASIPVALNDYSQNNLNAGLLFPNPNDGSFELKLYNPSVSKYRFEIYDILGKKLDEGTVVSENGYKIDATNKGLKQGIYFLNLISSEGRQTFKFVKQ